jgi:hypothetical protein
MFDENGRFAWIIMLARVLAILICACMVAAIVATVGSTYTMASAGSGNWTLYVAEAAVILAELAGIVLALVGYALVKIMVGAAEAMDDIFGRLNRVETLSDDTLSSVKSLVDLASLTDKAKSYIFREHEVEALRETIHHNVMLQDYAAAMALIDGMEKDFGYSEEAAKLRDELDATRKATQEEKIDAAINRIQEIIDRHDWARATREAQRMIALLPNNEKIAALPQRIEAAKTTHKRQLLQAYGDAVRKNDVDKSIELLKQLDLYLTPQEAAALQESARGVFRAKLHNLGVQFAICVTDQRWAEAVATGEEIIKNYPNSRMAIEVREKMNLLRARSTATTSS